MTHASAPPQPHSDQLVDVIEQIDTQSLRNPRPRPSKPLIQLPRSTAVRPHSAPSPRAGVDDHFYAAKHSISLPPHSEHPSTMPRHHVQRPMTALGTSHAPDTSRSSKALETPHNRSASVASSASAAPTSVCSQSSTCGLQPQMSELGYKASGTRRVMSAPYARHVATEQRKWSHSPQPVPLLRAAPLNSSLYTRPASAAGYATPAARVSTRPWAVGSGTGSCRQSLDVVSVSPLPDPGLRRPSSAQAHVGPVARAPTEMLQTLVASAISQYVKCK